MTNNNKDVSDDSLQLFNFNISKIKEHCEKINDPEDKLIYVNRLRAELDIYFLDKYLIIKYDNNIKIIKNNIDKLYNQYLTEVLEYRIDNSLKSKSNMFPRFNYDIDKILTYSEIIDNNEEIMIYLKTIKNELFEFTKKYTAYNFHFANAEKRGEMSKSEFNSFINKKYDDYLKDKEVANKIIKKLNFAINKHKNSKYPNRKKTDKKTIIGKYIWLKDVIMLRKLIKLLQENDFIENILENDPESEGYLSNFLDKYYNKISEVKPIRIRHIGKDTEICMIVGELKRRGYIADIDIWENSLRIFQFKEGKTANGLSHAYITGKPKRFDLFENLLNIINR